MTMLFSAAESAAGTMHRVFSDPVSVAVVGASADRAKWGYWLAVGALEGRDRRPVYLVNRGGTVIAGVSSHRSLRELPEIPELVAIAVPGPAVIDVIRTALELGSRAFLVVSARVEDERGIRELLREYGARMIGPNSLGVYSAGGRLRLMWGAMRAGSLAIVSQSGQLGSEIAALGARAGVGVSRFVSLGNQVDVRAAEVLRSLVQYGLIVGRELGDDTYFDADSLVIARKAASFLEHGIEVRHLRMFKVAAEREAGFLEQLAMPLLKQRNPQARREAVRLVEELADHGHDLRAALLRANLRKHLDTK